MVLTNATAQKINRLVSALGYSAVKQAVLPLQGVECSNLLSLTCQESRKNSLGIRLPMLRSGQVRWSEAMIQQMRDLAQIAYLRSQSAYVVFSSGFGSGAVVRITPLHVALATALKEFSVTAEGRSSHWKQECADIVAELAEYGFSVQGTVSTWCPASVARRSITRRKGQDLFMFATATRKDKVQVMPEIHKTHSRQAGSHPCTCRPLGELSGAAWNARCSVRLSNGQDSHRMMVISSEELIGTFQEN